jgi:hypothetical protein
MDDQERQRLWLHAVREAREEVGPLAAKMFESVAKALARQMEKHVALGESPQRVLGAALLTLHDIHYTLFKEAASQREREAPPVSDEGEAWLRGQLSTLDRGETEG